MTVWVDGKIVPPHEPAFAAQDRGLLLGDGLFETVRTTAGTPIFLGRHLSRLEASADALDLPIDREAIEAGLSAVLARANGPGSLRITVTRGPGPRGLVPIPRSEQRPSVSVAWAQAARRTNAVARLSLSTIRRNPTAPSCLHKTLSYVDAAAARAEAAAAGADDALMLGTTGRAACTSMANIWALTPEGFVTPPLEEGVLGGIVRAVLLEAGRVGDRAVKEAPLDEAVFRSAPLFRSNSLLGVQRAALVGGAAPCSDNPLGVLYERLEREEGV